MSFRCLSDNGRAGPHRLYLNATDGNAFGPLPAPGLCFGGEWDVVGVPAGVGVVSATSGDALSGVVSGGGGVGEGVGGDVESVGVAGGELRDCSHGELVLVENTQ